jgi:hypothetical protein
MKAVKIVKHETVMCPKLKKQISAVDCYETRQGISNILSPIGIEDETAMLEICNRCEEGKSCFATKARITQAA